MSLFVGAQTIRIVVADTSATHQVDTEALRQALIRNFAAPSNHAPLRTPTEGNADRTLSLEIIDEDGHETKAYPSVDGAAWQFQVVISASLTNREGQLLWTNPSWPFSHRHFLRGIHQREVIPGWSDPGFRKQFDADLASRLVYKIISR